MLQNGTLLLPEPNSRLRSVRKKSSHFGSLFCLISSLLDIAKSSSFSFRAEFAAKIREKDDEVAAKEKEAETKIKSVEEILGQTEADADKEIIELKTK